MRKKRLVVLLTAVLGSIATGLAAANLFPDQTWKAMNDVRELISVLPTISSQQRPPQPPTFHGPEVSEEPYVDVNGYAVLSAWKHYWAQEYPIFVRREVEPDPKWMGRVLGKACIPSQLRDDYSEAVTDFNAKLTRHWSLEERFSPANQFVVLHEFQLPVDDVRKGIPANALGFFAFSAVGFNRQGNRAVVYVVRRDGHFGWGEVFLMRRTKSGAWKIAGNGDCGWIT